jgi:hypothetical protein
VLLAKQRRRAGVVWTAVAGLWVVLVLGGVIALGLFTYRRTTAAYQPPEGFDPASYTGAVGRIELSHKGEAALQAWSAERKKAIRFTSKDGVVLAPVGEYMVHQFEAMTPDAKGEVWVARGVFSGSQPSVQVKDGVTVSLTSGAPFKAEVKVKAKPGDQAELELLLTGADGLKYTLSRRSGPTAPPRFEVFSATEELVWQGKFEYG